MTFRLTTLLYLFALLASSMAVFGVSGLFIGGIIFAQRAHYYWHVWPHRRLGFAGILLVAVLGLGAISFQVIVTQAHTLSRRSASLDNLTNIQVALMQYHAAKGHYPPPYVTDAQGKPLYSWRVLLLPYLEQEDLAKKFAMDEAWDSPHNLALLEDLGVFQSLWRSTYMVDKTVPGEAHYFAIVGDETIWNPNKPIAEKDITDGRDQTIVLIEAKNTGIKWSEPRDFTLDEAVTRLRQGPVVEWVRPGYFVSHRYRGGRFTYHYVLFADGRVEPIDSGSDPGSLRAMLTRAGQENSPTGRYGQLDGEREEYVGLTIHWGRIWGLAFWIAMVLLPSTAASPFSPAAMRTIFRHDIPPHEKLDEHEE